MSFDRRARPLATWARSLLSPRERFLPGLGARLAAKPGLAATVLVGLRSVPGRRLRTAVYRNVSLPLVRRMTGLLEVPVSGGWRMLVDPADVLGRMVVTTGVWEPDVTAALRSLLRPGDVFVDVGANVGYHTLLASRLVGPGGRVLAVEPGAASYAALRANLDLNGTSNVTALQVAAGFDETKALLFDPPPGNLGRSSIRYSHRARSLGDERLATGTQVDVRPLSELLPADDRERLRLVKIDVEGYEVEVLRGLESVLRAGARTAVLVEVHVGAAPEAPAYLSGFCEQFSLTAHVFGAEPPPGERPEEAKPGAAWLRSLRVVDPRDVAEGHFDLLLTPP
jgi:FkbM family methyltransferase